MNDRLSTCILAFAISLSVNPACTTAADPETLKRIDDQLTQLKDFEFGQNGNFIRDLENTIFRLPVDSSDRDVIEKKLVDAIEGANNIARGVICRQLRVIGTDRCVSSIAPLLSDLEVSPFARYALEGIGSEAALNAMHEALDRVPGQLQIGLLNSLSRVRYEPMRADCVRLSKVDDFQIASEAIRALGRLGGTEAIDSLRQLQGEVSKKLEQDVELALLACADRASSEGESDSAAEVYASIFAKSSTNRIAGLRGLVVAKPEQSVGILMDAISGEDSRLAASAIRMTTSLPGKTVTSRCVDLLEAIAVERKILLIKALGIRGDDSAVSAINVATQHPDSAVRLAAVEALGGLSGSEAVDTLIRAAADRNDQTVSRIARASLRRIADADSHLVSLAENGNETVAVEAMRALASRKASSATAAVIKLAQSSSTPKRRAAIETLGLLADPGDVKAVIDLAVESKVTDDQPKIEQALGRVLLKISSAEDRARPLLKALPKASNENRGVLIRQLSKAGTPEALKAVRESIKSTDPATVTSAVTALANWPNSSAANDLTPLIEGAASSEQRKQALEGYIRIATNSDDPSRMLLNLLKQMTTVDNRKRIVNEIGLTCESFEAIDVTQSLFSNPQLKAVAGIATVRIAYKLRRQYKEDARKVLLDVRARVDHPDVQKRALDVLVDLDKYEDHIRNWVAIGPFEDKKITSGEQSYTKVFAPEQPDTSGLDWKPLTLGIGSWDINLEAAFGAKDHCSAFVRTMIWSPETQDVQVEGGADDALKIWMNGEQIHEGWRTGGCAPRDVLVPARLKEGWNELKLKVTDHEGGWQFGCRVRNTDGTKIDGLKFEAR